MIMVKVYDNHNSIALQAVDTDDFGSLRVFKEV